MAGDYFAIFVDMQQGLKAYLRSLLHSHEDAEDAFQETFLILCDRLSTFDARRDFASWVRGIARNVALRKRRAYGRDRSMPLERLEDARTCDPASDPAPSTTCALSAITGVRAWIAQLGSDQQRMVMMRYVERLGVDAIATTLGKSEAAVYMALSRIRGSLQHSIERQRKLASHQAGLVATATRELPTTPADEAEETTVALRLLVSGAGLLEAVRLNEPSQR